ncbi:MAG: hypothetical protein ABWY05_03810 [Noviherbaspirillum sp.]
MRPARPAGAASATGAAGSWRGLLYLSAIVVFLVASLGQLPSLLPAASALALVSILVSLPACGPVARILTLLFLAGGYLMLWRAGVGWPQYLLAHGDMLYLLALFAVLPLLSIPVQLGQYSRSIEAVLRARISGVFQLNCVVTVLAFLCGSFMSLAAVPIMITSMAPVVGSYPLRDATRFSTVSTIYGYVLPILWTPVSGVVGVVLYSLRLEWTALLPVLMGLSVAALLLNWALFWLIELRGRPAPVMAVPASRPPLAPALRHLAQMLLAIVLMVMLIGVFDRVLRIGMLTVVTLLAIPFALAWSMALGKGAAFLRAATQEMTSRLPRLADQFAIFLAAGFFVSAMHLSGADDAVNQAFLALHQLLGTRLFLLAMPLMALAASMVGLHPLVAIALLGQSLKPEVLGIEVELLALTLIGSSVLTYMLGPFSGTLGLVQSLTRIPSYRLALWNLPYALGYVALLATVILMF